ncbi:MAG: hypothetical protein ACI4F5_09800 [Acutalibacteraceae bacterium]
MCSKGKCLGMAFAAFGAGLLLSLCFPTKFMLFVLAVSLIILGIIVSR